MGEKLEQLKEKLEKLEDKRLVDPSMEDWRRFAPSIARAVMFGAIKAVLKLDDEEAKNTVLREAGFVSLETFLENFGKGWATVGMPMVATSVLSGAFKGICKLDDRKKEPVLKAMAAACFERGLGSYKHYGWEEAGVSLAPGSHDIDSAIYLEQKQLSLRNIRREGDDIIWEGHVAGRYGKCSCCLVWADITEPVFELCQCATWGIKHHLEYFTGIPMQNELIESLNCGGKESCLFRVHLKPSKYATR